MMKDKEKALSQRRPKQRIKANTRLFKAVFFVLSISNLGGNYHENSNDNEQRFNEICG